MNRLPQELLDRIARFSDPDDLKQLLTVSRAFQHAVEYVSGVFAEFNLKRSNGQRFLQLYSGHRFAYLRHLRFRPILPAVDNNDYQEGDKPIGCRATPERLLERDEAFTERIRFLFDTLKTLEERVGYDDDDNDKFAKLTLSVFAPKRRFKWGCMHRVCICWRIHLLRPHMLPNLQSVRCLQLTNGDKVYPDRFVPLHQDWCTDDEETHATAKLDLRILIDLATKLPNLEYLGCKLNSYRWGMTFDHEVARHYMYDWPGPHRDTRHAFGTTIETAIATATLPHSLEGLSIILHWGADDDLGRDQRERLPNLVHPLLHDPFSGGLRLLSYRLQHMVLKVIADHTLFWPTDGTLPTWPNLKTLNVCFKPGSPSGAWYFQGPNEEGSDASTGYHLTDAHYEPYTNSLEDKRMHYESYVDYRCSNNSFRVVPLNGTLVPLLSAFASAAMHMPALQKAVLWSYLTFMAGNAFPQYSTKGPHQLRYYGNIDVHDSGLAWAVMYAAPGHHFEPYLNAPSDKHCPDRQMWWTMMDWRPDDDLLALFRRIGHTEHGNGLREYLLDAFGDPGMLKDQGVVGLDDLDTVMFR